MKLLLRRTLERQQFYQQIGTLMTRMKLVFADQIRLYLPDLRHQHSY